MKKRITLIVFSVLIIVALYVLYCFNYIPHKKYTNADFNIEAYKSNIDKDNDGIDDQTDILNNANNYIKTNPKYKSKSYYISTNPIFIIWITCVVIFAFIFWISFYVIICII